jgi:hypothetical protein
MRKTASHIADEVVIKLAGSRLRELMKFTTKEFRKPVFTHAQGLGRKRIRRQLPSIEISGTIPREYLTPKVLASAPQLPSWLHQREKLLQKAHSPVHRQKLLKDAIKERIESPSISKKTPRRISGFGLTLGQGRGTKLREGVISGSRLNRAGHGSMSELHPAFHGMGLGKKHFGEVVRRQPKATFYSDASVSGPASRSIESVGRGKNIQLWKNPKAERTDSYTKEVIRKLRQSPQGLSKSELATILRNLKIEQHAHVFTGSNVQKPRGFWRYAKKGNPRDMKQSVYKIQLPPEAQLDY